MAVPRGNHVSMVLFAVALHLWWVFMVLIDRAAINATGVSSLYRYFHSVESLLSVVAGASLMAFGSLFIRSSALVILMVIPQQVLLMISAAGAVEAMWLAQFADGVIRPRAFIAADQIYSVLAVLGHTIAIVFHERD